MSKKTMQAVQVHEYGGPNVLKVGTVERPQPEADEVLVRIVYAAIIPLDFKIRNGWLQRVFPVTLPYIPGFYASGVVEEVGPSVTELAPGDRVFGTIRGAYAEYGVAKVPELVKVPDNLALKDAATIKAGAEAAWKALFTEGELQAGQTVLVHAAAGGVGQFAVQLAKWKGATVLATASAANLDFVKSLGADQVIDYTTTNFEDVAKEVDLVVDSVGGETETRSWAVLRKGGIFVSLTQDPSQEDAQKHGVTAKFNTKFTSREDLEILTGLIAEGTITAEVDSVFPFDQADQALEKSEARRGRGRILLNVSAV
ncbi:NADP-dependent oxidoreductase [Cohnella ginsengisoli]|uniref:NADP-dependent oxidoreductase n=1 Tax=Cohnella ginsengisoli TaxID=425004 RepID=A0A9X4KN62_9BACL|nr:NADP-dependent oxidoreductase [Cohnella ginsengisoli]MDG0795118.1 NADP-dependent oxidoreductase [Cohnella ginsengisoli]